MSLLKWGLLLVASLSFFACSDDNEGEDGNGGNTQPIESVHYDVWVGLEQNAMGKFGTMLVKSVNSLEEQANINFKGEGYDATTTFGQTDACIIKGKYYYQVDAIHKDRFVKYELSNNNLTRLAEQPFKTNSYTEGRYTHAWLDDNTLVILAANGDADEVIWTKINARTMEIIAEGNLGLKGKTDVTKFTTSGLAAYRKSDNQLIYLFKHNPGHNKVAPPYFYAAFVNATTMEVGEIVKEERAEEMAGTAFGELRQQKMFFDENENLYIACNSQIEGSEKMTCQYGSLLRILKGEKKFDAGFFKYLQKEGNKIVTVDYMGNNKVLLYLQDPKHTGNSTDNKLYAGWGQGYNCYYALYDLTSGTLSEFEYGGKNLPFCSGTFSQRSFVHNGKAFIGVNPKDSQPQVYVYDIQKGTLEKGSSIQEGYEFSRIVYITD